jgi:hypothetical protein
MFEGQGEKLFLQDMEGSKLVFIRQRLPAPLADL